MSNFTRRVIHPRGSALLLRVLCSLRAQAQLGITKVYLYDFQQAKTFKKIIWWLVNRRGFKINWPKVTIIIQGEIIAKRKKGYCEFGMWEKQNDLLLVVKECSGQDKKRDHWIRLEGRVYVKTKSTPGIFFLSLSKITAKVIS